MRPIRGNDQVIVPFGKVKRIRIMMMLIVICAIELQFGTPGQTRLVMDARDPRFAPLTAVVYTNHAALLFPVYGLLE